MSTPLTDADRVIAASGTTLTGDTLDMLIEDAHRLVETLLGAAGLTTETLEAIERYYACHLCWTVDTQLRIKSDSTGASSYSVEGDERFLKAAIALDPTGKLQAHVNSNKVVPFVRTIKTTRVPAKNEVVGGTG